MPDQTTAYSAKNPYRAHLQSVSCLNQAGSQKDTRHVIVGLGKDGPQYQPGDTLAVFPRNDPALVEQIIAWLGVDPGYAALLPKDKSALAISEALERLDITHVPRSLLQPLATQAQDPLLRRLSDPTEKSLASAYCDGRDLLDLLWASAPQALSAQELVDGLRPLLPRLYSIASSPSVHPGEVHLTVGLISWETHGRLRQGVASNYLGKRLSPGDELLVFVNNSKHFHLPEDLEQDIIMIGPGTGISPFRGFLEERRLSGARGRNWLFFGDQHVATDFLYRDELMSMQDQGILHRLDLAFSRDQGHNIYVQHRMLERATELWHWIDNGAVVYVCGDALRMAPDVDAALQQIIHQQAGMNLEDAAAYLRTMKKELRYRRDVYAV